jgi:hypothetical protein
MGMTPVKTVIQLESMDEDLRTSLWNVFREFCLDRILSAYITLSPFSNFFRKLWADFFKKPVDTLDDRVAVTGAELRKWFLEEAQWYGIYDFVEFVANSRDPGLDGNSFRSRCNAILERELAGYRFVGHHINPISNDAEVKEIEQALENANENRLAGVTEHVNAALSKLSDRKHPDYRNSIKESISAVESVSKVISGDPKADLGKALKVIKTKIDLHPALEQGFLKIYGYTSDEGGIRHALLDESTCDFEDAKFMLVACSAFINYLIMKGEKAELF